ncbi:hypothetical protein [Lapillicoccus sp.]|uniref:hypothetical protein n=1 Tax=Lapillicoccus sp. TaxID=1909287 RepID=UPI00398343F0
MSGVEQAGAPVARLRYAVSAGLRRGSGARGPVHPGPTAPAVTTGQLVLGQLLGVLGVSIIDALGRLSGGAPGYRRQNEALLPVLPRRFSAVTTGPPRDRRRTTPAMLALPGARAPGA